MFLNFLVFLRTGGMKVSLNEWLSLIDGMQKGLHGQTLRGFFILTRTLLVKTETDMDRFEELFYQFFKDISSEELRKEMEALLHHPEEAEKIFAAYMENADLYPEKLLQTLEMRMHADDMNADSMGSVTAAVLTGTGEGKGLGIGPGNGSILQGGGGKSIVHSRGDRKFRDWRTDCTVESRQFQMAFRLLRELSRKLDTNEEELDIYGTIHATCRQGGILDIKMQPPRRNRLKVLVLIDSGGTMQPYEELCSLLFQSLHKANTFSDLKIYYFHNCLEDVVYKDPSIDTEETIKTEWILRNIKDDYRVIFVGDADMAPYELGGDDSHRFTSSHADGITWFKRFREKYKHSIWFHPQERQDNFAWTCQSFVEIEKVFPMFRLSIDGLKDGMYQLMKNH